PWSFFSVAGTKILTSPAGACPRAAAVDQAISHLHEGRTAEVRALAEEMLAVFQGLEVSREPMAAVLLFHEAAVQEIATAELAREIAAALSRTLAIDLP
ncbi:MAG: hypothetical protein ABUL63_01705, partial [Acidobacteriota bacterium]